MALFYKIRQILLQQATYFITKRDKMSLQNVSGFLFQNGTVITKCDDIITKMQQLLRNAVFIKKSVDAACKSALW